MRGPAFFAYADNYLIDVKFGIIMDVEASPAIRQIEVEATKTMIERTEERFDIKPELLAADTANWSAANLYWLVEDKLIAPHIPVTDKSKREDGTFSREDFTFYKEGNIYICRRSRSSPQPARSWMMTRCCIGRASLIATRARTRCVAAPRSRPARSRAASMRRPVTSPVCWARSRRSSSRVATASALRCCSLT